MLLELIQKVQEKDNARLLSSILFVDFVKKTSPATSCTELPYLAEHLLQRFLPYCDPDENGNIGVVRGGSMRAFTTDNFAIDKKFAGIYKDIDNMLVGDDPLAKRVVEKVFADPKDIDISLRLKHSNVIFDTLAHAFKDLGIRGLINQNLAVFYYRNYRIELIKHLDGNKHKQALVKVNITDLMNNDPVLKLHFAAIPGYSSQIKDTRWDDEAADGDTMALGFLSTKYNIRQQKDEMQIRYFAVNKITPFNDQLLSHFYRPLGDMLSLKGDFTKEMSRLQRSINFRASYYHAFSHLGKGNLVGLFDLDEIHKKPEKIEMQRWIFENETMVRNRLILLLSDAYYGYTANPFISLLFSYANRVLFATGLGDIFQDPPSVLLALDHVAKGFGKSVIKDSIADLSFGYLMNVRKAEDTGPFKLMEWMQEMGMIPEDEPNTITKFLHLNNPLALIGRK